MNLKHISIFNLIEIFKGRRKEVLNTISPKTHCEQNHISDFYCDAERPYIMSNSMLQTCKGKIDKPKGNPYMV